MKIFHVMRDAIMGFAALLMAGTPIAASAQEATQYAVSYVAPSSEMVQTRVELAKGFTLTPEEAVSMGTYGCVIGPMATTTSELYAWAERKGVTPCTRDFYKKVDNYIGKESTLAFRAMAGADGYEYCPNMKVANLGNNRESCRTYPYNADYNPAGQVGKFADVNWATGGGTTTAQIGGALLGAVIAGPVTAATAQLTAKNNCGRNGCGTAIYNLNEGAQAVAASEANSAAVTETTISLGGMTGCTTCAATDPNNGY